MGRPAIRVAAGEMEILGMLWSGGPLTIRDAYVGFGAYGKPVSYPTMQTRLNRLAEKGLVVRSEDRPARYRAAVLRDRVTVGHLRELVEKICRRRHRPSRRPVAEREDADRGTDRPAQGASGESPAQVEGHCDPREKAVIPTSEWIVNGLLRASTRPVDRGPGSRGVRTAGAAPGASRREVGMDDRSGARRHPRSPWPSRSPQDSGVLGRLRIGTDPPRPVGTARCAVDAGRGWRAVASATSRHVFATSDVEPPARRAASVLRTPGRWETLMAPRRVDGLARGGHRHSWPSDSCAISHSPGGCSRRVPPTRSGRRNGIKSRTSRRSGLPILLVVSGETGPALCWSAAGYRLVVPGSLWAGLAPHERAAILRHELEHYRRGDLWTMLLARVPGGLPLVQSPGLVGRRAIRGPVRVHLRPGLRRGRPVGVRGNADATGFRAAGPDRDRAVCLGAGACSSESSGCWAMRPGRLLGNALCRSPWPSWLSERPPCGSRPSGRPTRLPSRRPNRPSRSATNRLYRPAPCCGSVQTTCEFGTPSSRASRSPRTAGSSRPPKRTPTCRGSVSLTSAPAASSS